MKKILQNIINYFSSQINQKMHENSSTFLTYVPDVPKSLGNVHHRPHLFFNDVEKF